jgi:MoaA/NifB/PqqE/SkfB family radical SAM enzyme
MFKFDELKMVHLEISNNCQASCPMCARNINGGPVNPLLMPSDWSLDDFKTIMNPEVLNQIYGFYFCGNYGDPILNNELINMCKYATEVAPNCQNIIHTNGGARNTKWWQELARAMPKHHRVVFALDGLSDTHSLYRIGTKFETVIENAKAFIDAGGNAEWVFIRFQHNMHQVNDAEIMARELGFSEFTVKNSSRFLLEAKINVINRKGEHTHVIEPAGDTPMKFIDKKTIDNFHNIMDNSIIDCKVQKDKEIFIDAHKNMYPCCHTGAVPYLYHTQPELQGISKELHDQHYDMVKTLGELNVVKRSIKEIINSHEYQTAWETYWTVKKLIICVRTCGVSADINFSRPREQWKDYNG